MPEGPPIIIAIAVAPIVAVASGNAKRKKRDQS